MSRAGTVQLVVVQLPRQILVRYVALRHRRRLKLRHHPRRLRRRLSVLAGVARTEVLVVLHAIVQHRLVPIVPVLRYLHEIKVFLRKQTNPLVYAG